MRSRAEWEHQIVAGITGVAAAVETSRDHCDKCGAPVGVQKTIERRVATLEHGLFHTRETVMVCMSGCTHPSGHLVTRRSEVLQKIVPVGATYGYDIEVLVGLERFVRYRQREEIRSMLEKDYGIPISIGEVSVLARRFLSHLQELHLAHTESIRQVLARDGGYPLHIDATCEDGQGTLFVAYAGWREWVLGAWKISTERADVIRPLLQSMMDQFGEPRAIVRDLGRAGTKAVGELVGQLDPQPRVLACHQHFLCDVGKDLLKRDHDQLRQLFRNFRVRGKLGSLVRKLGCQLGKKIPSLLQSVEAWADQGSAQPLPAGPEGLAIVRSMAQWILDYANDGQNQGFPFERPYLDLFRRCCTVYHAVDTFRQQTAIDRDVLRVLNQLSQLLAPVNAEVAAQRLARKLEAPAKLFDDLRAVLRLDGKLQASSPNLITPEEQAEFLKEMEMCFTDFCNSLRERRAAQGLNKDEQKALDIVIKHLDRHGRYLWGHVLQMPEEAGGGIRIVARTNNILEGFFRHMKHGERRRSGRKVLTQDFEGLPAAAALACNLARPGYVQLVCGSLEELPARFCALDMQRREAMFATPKGTLAKPAPVGVISASLPLADRRLIRKHSLRDRIQAAANQQKFRSLSLQPSQPFEGVSLHAPAAMPNPQSPNEGSGGFVVYVPRRRVSTRSVPSDTRTDPKTSQQTALAGS